MCFLNITLDFYFLTLICVECALLTGPTCSSSANSQMADLVSYLKSNCASAWSGRVWLDIEGTQYWLGNTASNQAWYQVSV